MQRCVMSLSAALALAIALTTSPAGAQGSRTPGSGNGSHDRQGGTHLAAAVAHLQGVGDAAGWGRLMIKDRVGASAGERSAALHLFGLAPDATYSVEVDGILLTAVTTDVNGDAWTLLGSGNEASAPFPADLPPTVELVSALVLDASLAPTLAGDLVAMAGGGWGSHGDLVYAERVTLVNGSSDWPRGVARVGRTTTDEQLFESNAGGLEAGATYLVLVDGTLAGQVTTDAVGHARLALTTGSPDAVLPAELTPIEELRLVEWTTRDGAAILTGIFTGSNQVGDGSGSGDGNGDGNGDCTGDCDGGPGDGNGDGNGDCTGDCDGSGDGHHGDDDAGGGNGDSGGGPGGGHGGGTP